MNLKNMNKLEQHVEKIVLAAAAAGALYLGYLAIQPVTIPNSNLPVDQVEVKLSEQINTLNATAETNLHKTITRTDIDYAQAYQVLIHDRPLKPEVVDVRVPPFAPTNLALRAGPSDGEIGPTLFKIVTPTPVAPEMITADVWQQSVASLTPAAMAAGGIQPPAPGASLATRDMNAVVLQGYVPVAKMLAQMQRQKIQDHTRLPEPLIRASIYRMEVQRRQRTPTGWTEWSTVPPSVASPLPKTNVPWDSITTPEALAGAMNQVDSEFKQIVVPDFYLDAQGVPIQPPILKTPPTKIILDKMKELQKELAEAMGTTVPTGQGGMYVNPTAPPPGEDTEAGVQPTYVSADVAALKNQPMVPFCFWDETVEPDHIYQYQVRVAFVNPTYAWEKGLKVPAMNKQSLLYSPWVAASPESVLVNPDMLFFVMGSNISRTANRISVWVYKRTGGKWYRGDFDAQPGMGIAGKINLLDKTGPDNTLDVDTGYTVVDVVNSGDNSHVVLSSNDTGALSTHDSSYDRGPAKQLLPSATTRPAPPPSTLPAGGARGGRGGGLGGGLRSTPGRGPGTPANPND